MWEKVPSDASKSRHEMIAPVSLADPPTLQLRWLFGIAVMAPMLLATGVYWLHHLPDQPGPTATNAIMEVRLIAPGTQLQPSQPAILQPSQPPIPPVAPPVEEQSYAAPEIATPAAPSAVVPSPPAVAPADPGSSKIPMRKASSRTTSAFQRTLLAHIARYQNYPDEARRNGTQGTVQVVFAMRRNGSVTSIRVQVSSGYGDLDAAAVDTIRRAQPLPPIPSELPDSLNILIPVAFDLP
jgi:periplasmic protein TonB